MIHGIGTDLVAVGRLDAMFAAHGERALARLLAPDEREECRRSSQPGRYLAKRFAAKEALGKALGTGIRAPVLLTQILVTHDELGKPGFAFLPPLADWLAVQKLTAHLSLSDEGDLVAAFVVVERP